LSTDVYSHEDPQDEGDARQVGAAADPDEPAFLLRADRLRLRGREGQGDAGARRAGWVRDELSTTPRSVRRRTRRRLRRRPRGGAHGVSASRPGARRWRERAHRCCCLQGAGLRL